MTDKHTLDLAREWAEHVQYGKALDDVQAARKVIASLPGVIVDGDKLREVINEQLSSCQHGTVEHRVAEDLACKLESLFPIPKPRTLADMSPEERAGCQWMQADHVEHGRIIITYVSDEYVHYLKMSGGSVVLTPIWLDKITPLPNLPRMEWPAGEPASLRPEDVPVGEAWQVEAEGRVAIGYRNDPDDEMWPWKVAFSQGGGFRGGKWLADDDVTLIARLVPETTEQDEEPEIHPAHTYRDKEGDEWEHLDGRWVTGVTHARRVEIRNLGLGRYGLPVEYGPYTRIEEEQ